MSYYNNYDDYYYDRPSTMKTVLIVALCVGLLLMAFSVVPTLFERIDEWTELNLAYDVGDINLTDGRVISDSRYLISQSTISCTGVNIVPNPNRVATCRVIFYTKDLQYVGYAETQTTVLTFVPEDMPYLREVPGNVLEDSGAYKNSAVVEVDGKPVQASVVRVCIYPDSSHEDMFSGFSAWVTKLHWAQAFDVNITNRLTINASDPQ